LPRVGQKYFKQYNFQVRHRELLTLIIDLKSMNENSMIVKVESLLEQEMKSLQLLFERHQFHTIALYKEIPELGEVFDPKTASVKPKLLGKNSQFSMSQRSFSRYSNGARPTKSPKCNIYFQVKEILKYDV